MIRIFLIFIILFFTWNIKSQEVITRSYSTNEILEYCKQKGADSTLSKFNCNYISLIDSSTCIYIVNSLKGNNINYSSFDSHKNFMEPDDYLPKFKNRHYFIIVSSAFIKNQTLLELLMENLSQSLNQSPKGYLTETLDIEISSLVFQIRNTDHDSLLIVMANKWRKKTNEYNISGYSPLRINLPVLFTGNYSKKVNNYLDCLNNEKKYLLAYNSINSNYTGLINERITNINREIYNITKSQANLEHEYFINYSFKDYNVKIEKMYKTERDVITLAELDFNEFIYNNIQNHYTTLSLILIHNEKVGIINYSLSFMNKRHAGYAQYITSFIELQNNGDIISKALSEEFIN